MTHDQPGPSESGDDGDDKRQWLFGVPPDPDPPPIPPPVEARCLLITPQPRAFPRVRHAAEVPTTAIIDGITRMQWTCTACGHVRGRVT